MSDAGANTFNSSDGQQKSSRCNLHDLAHFSTIPTHNYGQKVHSNTTIDLDILLLLQTNTLPTTRSPWKRTGSAALPRSDTSDGWGARRHPARVKSISERPTTTTLYLASGICTF